MTKRSVIVVSAVIAAVAVAMLVIVSAGVRHNPLKGVRSVTAGGTHSCASTTDGKVFCWGSNSTGQLGDVRVEESRIPVPVKGISDAASVSAGNFHTCALLKNGSVACWGSNSSGQLGSDASSDSRIPVIVQGVSGASSVSSGWNHACALLKDGTVWCWGDNSTGQLGTGEIQEKCHGEAYDFSCSKKPVKASGLAGATQLSAGGNHTCAVMVDGSMMCWGANDHSELGLHTNKGPDICRNGGINLACAMKPEQSLKVKGAAIAASGGYHTCFTNPSGVPSCWGPNRMGQLARENSKGSFNPVTVAIPGSAVDICSGLMHNCVVTSSGRVLCWGGNTSAQLGVPAAKTPGQGNVAPHSAKPVEAAGVKNAVSVSCGFDNTCAVIADGTVWCWGGNGYGKLGVGSTNAVAAPGTVAEPVTGR
jgi:alpha-tubulin suppressor-like RCC1 family protein